MDWKELAKNGNIKDAMLKYIETRTEGGCTFNDIQEDFSEFVDLKGDLEILYPGYENIIIWSGMSDEFVRILSELRREYKIHLVPTHILTHLVGGGCLNIPIAKSARDYKTPRWLPMVIYYGSGI